MRQCGIRGRNLISILPSYRYEVLPPSPPLLSPQEPPVQSVLPALRPFQLRAPHSLASGAQGSCTGHSACAQGAPHSHRCSTYRCHRPPSCRRQLSIFHSFSSRSCSLQRGDLFFLQLKQLPSNLWWSLLFFPFSRFAVKVTFDANNTFESCCCWRSLVY